MAIKRQDYCNGGVNHYNKSECPVCGKEFEHTKSWAYWRGYVKNKLYICSWGCTQIYDETQPPKKLKGEKTIA